MTANFKKCAELAERTLDKLRYTQKKIVIWGCGPHTFKFLNIIDSIGIKKPIGIFDTTRIIHEDTFSGLPVISLDEVHSFGFDNVILIISPGLNELFGDVVPNELYYYETYHRRSIEASKFLSNNLEHLNENLTFIVEPLSQFTYIETLNAILRGNFFDNTIRTKGGPYFNNDIIKNINAHWFYAGLFNGKHFDRALQLHQSKTIKLTGSEPSSLKFEELKRKFCSNSNISILNALLWSCCNETMEFVDDASHGGLSASVFIPEGFGSKQKVTSTTIDKILIDKQVTDLSLDVEGSELFALEGAKETIHRCRPNLSLCIYHSLSDFVKVPKAMHDLTQAPIQIRQHSNIPVIETVAYAVNY